MMDNHSQYWTRVARKYDSVVDLQIGRTTRSLIRERVSEEDSLGWLVEFGCGTGFNTAILSAKADRLVATDFSRGMLTLTMERVKAPNLTFQIEDCQKTSFGDGIFDTAFMSLVIHFTEPLKTLIEMRDELTAIWQHAATSSDEMLGHLQRWIARAEASGIQALQEAAARIRSYKPGAA